MIPYKILQTPKQSIPSVQKLPVLSRIIIAATKLLPGSEIRLKLLFYQRFLQFLKTIALSIIQQNGLTERLKTGISVENLSRIEHVFYEMLSHYGIVVKTNTAYLFTKEYHQWSENDWTIIQQMVQQNNFEVDSSKANKQLVAAFRMVMELIQLYRHNNISFRYLKRVNNWKNLILRGKLDYEVRLSETLLGLKNLKFPEKIKSPFDDDYYTESGRNAFNNFTRQKFETCVQLIRKQHTIHTMLDIGCGYGNYIDAVHQLLPDAEITGIELQQKVYAETQKRFDKQPNIHLFKQNIFDFKSFTKFDLVLFNYVLFYFSNEDKLRLFRQLTEQLAENGSILICQYYAGIENLKNKLSEKQGEAGLAKQIEQYFGNKILYANALWNESSDAFVQSENWTEFEDILAQTGFEIVALTNADKFYYSLFVEIKRI